MSFRRLPDIAAEKNQIIIKDLPFAMMLLLLQILHWSHCNNASCGGLPHFTFQGIAQIGRANGNDGLRQASVLFGPASAYFLGHSDLPPPGKGHST
jgi:hypothetical protein